MIGRKRPKESSLEISVVMAVYKNDRAAWVKQAIDSILNQTRKPDEVVVVIDGKVSKNVQAVLDSYGGGIKQIPLDKNRGLWNALNVGIENAKYDLIARMDSDDISHNNRFEKQIKMFEKDGDLDLLGGQVAEFSETPDKIIAYRRVPESGQEIYKFAKLRSPFNHPTVMFKRCSVQRVGGYHELYRTEDYDLWVRMLQAGMKMENLPDVLLSYRVGQSNAGRKNSEIQHKEHLDLQERFYKSGFLSRSEYYAAWSARQMFYYLPSALKLFVYQKTLRSNELTSRHLEEGGL